mmetsp:Transcript_5900/g.14000  ORF Transcript_5900/g.14000 Transcript_5900/m.14000 type:complete len:203 (-) Transcript_5900:1242-1850(-)
MRRQRRRHDTGCFNCLCEISFKTCMEVIVVRVGLDGSGLVWRQITVDFNHKLPFRLGRILGKLSSELIRQRLILDDLIAAVENNDHSPNSVRIQCDSGGSLQAMAAGPRSTREVLLIKILQLEAPQRFSCREDTTWKTLPGLESERLAVLAKGVHGAEGSVWDVSSCSVSSVEQLNILFSIVYERRHPNVCMLVGTDWGLHQ